MTIILPWQCRHSPDKHFLKRDLCDKKRKLSKEDSHDMDNDTCPGCRGPIMVGDAVKEETVRKKKIDKEWRQENKDVINDKKKVRRQNPSKCTECGKDILDTKKTKLCQSCGTKKGMKKHQDYTKENARNKREEKKQSKIIKGLFRRGKLYWLRYADEFGKLQIHSSGCKDEDQAIKLLNIKREQVEMAKRQLNEEARRSYTLKDIEEKIISLQREKIEIDDKIKSLRVATIILFGVDA